MCVLVNHVAGNSKEDWCWLRDLFEVPVLDVAIRRVAMLYFSLVTTSKHWNWRAYNSMLLDIKIRA